MHRRTKSSQPGFMDARSRLVSSDVILPGQVDDAVNVSSWGVIDSINDSLNCSTCVEPPHLALP